VLLELLGDDELLDVLPLDVLLLPGDELLGVLDDGVLLDGVLVDGVDGVLGVNGVLGVVGVDGGVVAGDCVGQVALASITDPSGQVLVVGDVGGGVNVCVHDGSFGFVLQSTGGGVPVVQLPTHADPVPFPPDAGIVKLLPDVGVVTVKLLACDVDSGRVVGPSPQPNLLLRQLVTYAVLYPKLQ